MICLSILECEPSNLASLARTFGKAEDEHLRATIAPCQGVRGDPPILLLSLRARFVEDEWFTVA